MTVRGRVVGVAAGLVLTVGAVGAVGAFGQDFTPEVKEITIFKDGHALVLREAEVAPTEGTLTTTVVPESLLGTFWTFVDRRGPKLESVSVGWREVEEVVPCTSIIEVLRANAGKVVTLVVSDGGEKTVRGTLLSLAKRSETKETVETGSPLQPNYYTWPRRGTTAERTRRIEEATVQADFVAVRNEDTGAVTFLKTSSIQRVEVGGEPALTRKRTVRKRALTFRFDRRSRRDVKIAIVSVERGVRWIPEYHIDHAEGAATAHVRFQATVVNDIVDLKNVRAHFVVGVPRFSLGGKLSPLALAEVPRRLSSFFTPPSAGDSTGSLRYQGLSNAMMSQVAMPARGRAGAAAVSALPRGMAGERSADLFVYHRDGVSLKAGERASFGLWENDLAASEVYTWDIEPSPPKDLYRHMDQNRRRELGRRLEEPKVMRALRLTNNLDAPLTTGAAIVFRKGQPLSQDILTYTSTGNTVDVPITVAIDVNPSVRDEEVERKHNAVTISHSHYTRVWMRSELRLVNFSKKPRRVKITRGLFGKIVGAEGGNTATLSQGEALARLRAYPWWGYYRGSWPSWWWNVNEFSEAEWTVEIPPGEETVVTCEWEYLHR